MSDQTPELFEKKEFETVGELREYLERLPDSVDLKVNADGVMLDGATVEINNASLVIE